MSQSKWFEENWSVASPRSAQRWLGAALLPVLFASSCIGVSQKKVEASAPSKDALAACPGGLFPAAEGLLDDFEDGDNQGNVEGGRDGYWYTSHDSLGSEITIPASGFASAEGGADGSARAVHVKGKSSSAGDQAWGMELGLNFLNAQGEFFDASKYAAISFKARSGSPDADKKVRVGVADVNTHPSGNVCTACYNHFNSNIELTSEWKDYTLAFEDLRQRPYWGAPRPPRLTSSQVVNVHFQMGGGKDFDLWLDDVKFLECKSSSSGAPSTAASSGASAQPGGGVSMIGEAGIAAFQPAGATRKVQLRPISVTGQPFKEALEVAVKEPGQSAWEVQMTTPTKEAVKKDDVLLATFYARVEKEQEAGGGETEFVFELASEPYTKSVSYPVPLTEHWRKINVRFRAAADYAAGQAHLIFRLGYAPETIQIGGIRVENFAKSVLLTKLPSTQAVDRKLAARPPSIAPKLDPVDAGELVFKVNPAQVLGKISRLVYGINSQPFEHTGATVRRNGGNRGSAYNWEANFSNAGQDYLHQNDQWPCTIMKLPGCSEPAGQFLGFFAQNKAAAADTIVTVPMLDYVAADKNGPVKAEDKAPSARWVASQPRKGKPFADTPELKDKVVYEDEFVAYLVKKLGKADKGGVKFYSLDNEPALWSQTHPLVHPEPTTYEEMARRTEETASAIKDVDKSAFLLGGVMFGWSEYQSLGSAPDFAKYNADFGTYTDFFLDAMKRAEKKHGQRLIDALDVHWYPEARGSQRITEDDASRSTVDERLQAPRSLWDPTYTEKSWIAQQSGKPIRLIPWLKDIIQKRYPGTELCMTEYNYGGTTDVSGGLAQVDVLGVLGREGVYLATYWGKGAAVEPLPPYVAAAFALYRNYDGKGGKFGDTAVSASVANASSASVFAATEAGGALTVIAINKHQQNRYTGIFELGGGKAYKGVKTFVLDRSGTNVTPGKPAQLEGGQLRYTLEPLSATLFVLQKG